MASPKDKKHPRIQMTICPTKMSTEKEKKYKKKSLTEITKAVTALYNEGGGDFHLRIEKSPPKEHIKECIRKIEQRIQECIGAVTMTLNMQVQRRGPNQVIFTIRPPGDAHQLLTLNYNLYVPSDQQVIHIPASENPEKMKGILNGETPPEKPVPPGSHGKDFVKGRKVDFGEGKSCQFKMVKAEKTKNVSLADRIVGKNNKFSSYVSAYGNYIGGNIYIGIADDGTVEGEEVNSKVKKEIETKVSKKIDKMIWPDRLSGLETRRGKQWEIYFEPVKDDAGETIPSTFVIVIYVAQCPGGVFTEVPESYHVVDGEATKIDFFQWKRMLLRPQHDISQVPRRISASNFWQVHEMLTKLINKNCSWKELTQTTMVAKKNNKPSIKLTCLARVITYCFRIGEYGKAEELLTDYKNELKAVQSHRDVFEMMEQYLKCALERSRGNYEESYRISKACIEKADQKSPNLIAAAFYVLTATVINILAVQKKDRSLMKEAKQFYKKTETCLEKISEFPTAKADLRQKLYTNLALLTMGSSLTGEMIENYEDYENYENYENFEDLNGTGDELLKKVNDIAITEKYMLSDVRQIQFYFAQSCLYYRASCKEESSQRRLQLLEDARILSVNAIDRADRCELVEMKHYGLNRVEFFENELAKCT